MVGMLRARRPVVGAGGDAGMVKDREFAVHGARVADPAFGGPEVDRSRQAFEDPSAFGIFQAPFIEKDPHQHAPPLGACESVDQGGGGKLKDGDVEGCAALANTLLKLRLEARFRRKIGPRLRLQGRG
jgi:hypothetical protein